MRTLVDIPDEDVKWLDARARERGVSRAAILREVIKHYLEVKEREGFEKYFGLWERHGSTVDGLAYERELRDEWEDRDIEPPAMAKKRKAA